MNYLLITLSVASAIFVSASLFFSQPSHKKKSEGIIEPKNSAHKIDKDKENTKIFSLKKPQKIEFVSTDTKQLKNKNAAQRQLIAHLEQQNKRLNQENKAAKKHAKKQDKYIAALRSEKTGRQLDKQSPQNADVEQIKSLIQLQPDLITTKIKKQPDQQATATDTTSPSDWDNLTGLTSFGFSYEQDNKITKGINGRLLLTYTKPLKYKLNSDYDFKYETQKEQDQEDLATTNNSRWQLQFDRNLTPISTLFARTDLSGSHFSNYKEEYIYSIGYGRTLIDNSKHNLLMEIGPGYRTSVPNTGEKVVNVNEIITRLKLGYQYIASDALQLTFDSVLEVGHKNSIYTNNVQIQNKIYQKLFLAFEFEYKYTQNVPEDTLRDEYSSELKLLYAF